MKIHALMPSRRVILAAAVWVGIAVTATAQSNPRIPESAAQGPDRPSVSGQPLSPDRFRLVASSSNAQQMVNDYAARGYRLLSPDGGYLLFEKLPAHVQGPEYVLLSLTSPKELYQQLNQAASRGFRLSQTAISQWGYAVMEKNGGEPSGNVQALPTHHYQYEILEMRRESLDKVASKVAEIAGKGYRAVALYAFNSYDAAGDVNSQTHVIVLESIAADEGTSAVGVVARNAFTVVRSKDVINRKKRFTSSVSSGGRIIAIHDPFVLLETSSHVTPHEYLPLKPRSHMPARVARELQAAMNQAAWRGFRLRSDGLLLIFGWWYRLVVVMERSSHPGSEIEYHVIGTWRNSTFEAEFESAVAGGFTPVALISVDASSYFMVLQKPTAPVAGFRDP